MAGTASRPETLTYAIVYGLAGRPSQGRKLRRLLTEAGLKSADDVATADILILHSAGCWLIPPSAKARLVIWNGAPLAEERGHAYRHANLQIYRHASNWRIIPLFIGNVYQFLRHPFRNASIIRMAGHAKPVLLPGAAYVFIANRYDPWPRSRQLDTFLESKGWTFIGLPGSHDEIWQHPEYYAPIIKRYARLLAETDRR
jgi:hypothetical protein